MKVEIEGLEKIRKDLRKVGESLESTMLLQKAALYAQSLMLPRITSGKDIHGNNFPPYSTKPIYVSGRVKGYGKIKKNPQGKTGKTRFKNRKKHKSRYFPGGYAEFREYMGRSSTNDRLTMTNRMLGAMQVKMVSKGAIIYFVGKEANEKASGNQEIYYFFGLTDEERENVALFTQKQFEKIMREYIGNG